MKNKIILLGFIFCFKSVLGQVDKLAYQRLLISADSLFKVRKYEAAAIKFNQAFRADGGKGLLYYRYNSACAWALAKQPDSAFTMLMGMAVTGKFTDVENLSLDKDLKSLHNDKRWEILTGMVRLNSTMAEARIDKKLANYLDTIYGNDQRYRRKMDAIEAKYGWNSKEMNKLIDSMNYYDSLNVIKVCDILNKWGWVSADIAGETGNSVLFLVIQHADSATQEKYLPMMRDAVDKGLADADDLALLEDRVAMRRSELQIYGSQIGRHPITMEYYVKPLADPDNVDRRRAEVGLKPIAYYISYWGLVWNLEQYKQKLPEYIKLDIR